VSVWALLPDLNKLDSIGLDKEQNSEWTVRLQW